MRLLSATFLAAAVSAAAALPAQATICRHQPGQGAIDQYCEIIPNGAGERPDRTSGSGAPPSLPAQTSKSLSDAGSDGQSVAALAMTSPAPQLSTQGDGQQAPADEQARPDSSGGTAAGAAQPAASSGTLQALVGDVGDPGGGSWLPWALAAVALAAGLTAWLSRGRSS
jgi:hypothetical protein